MTHNHAINIPEDSWDPCGSDGDPTSRLLASININGTRLYVEAYAVAWQPTDDASVRVPRKDEDNEVGGVQVSADPEWDDVLAHVQEGIYGDGPWYTTWIRGREYVLFATPARD